MPSSAKPSLQMTAETRCREQVTAATANNPAIDSLNCSDDGALADLREAGMLDKAQSAGIAGQLGRYEILRSLGKGGMGIVLLARDSQDGRKVAVKLMRPQYGRADAAIRRFVAEARHMQRMRHPCVLRVFDVVENGAGSFYAMHYVHEGSLARRMHPGQAMELEPMLDIAMQVADALRYAHDDAGLIHRDIKPENILVDTAGRAYLSDFGLVRSVFNDSICEGAAGSWTVGTRPYMAPEIVDGKAGDTRADIYSFGAMLYELASGHAPYAGVDTGQILNAIRQGPPLPITMLAPQLPGALVSVIQGAMGRGLRDRYAHMTDLLADLGKLQNGQKPAGPRDPVRVPRPRRNILFAAVGFILIFTGILGFRNYGTPSSAFSGTPARAGQDASAPKPTANEKPAASLYCLPAPASRASRIMPDKLQLDRLNRAIVNNDLQSLKILIETENIDPNVELPNGTTPLESAIETDRQELADYLIKSDSVNLNAMLDHVNTGYGHIAAQFGQVKLMEMLQKSGVDLSRRDSSGKTSMDYADEYNARKH